MKNSRRFLALMLAFLLAFGNLSTAAMAAEGEGAGIQQTEPVSAEAPADAGTEAVPTEPVLEQAPAEPAQNAQPAEEAQPSEAPAEVPAEASSPEEAPASEAADAEMNEYSSAEAAPETEQPAAEPGVGGFKLPGVEVPEAPETEIVAPEPQADPSTNADNGIMPIAQSGNLEVTLKMISAEKDHYEVGDVLTFQIKVTNHRDLSSMQEIGVTYSGLSGIENVRFDEVGKRLGWETKSNGWHFAHSGWDSFGVLSGLHVNESTTITFDYVIRDLDVGKTLTLEVGAQNGWGIKAEVTETINNIQVKHTALKVEVTGEKKTVAYNGATQTADQYTVTVTNKNTSAAIDSSAVSVTVDDGYKASGTDADTYLMDLKGKVKVSVNNDKVYTLDQTDVTVTDGSLTIEPANVTITGPMLSMTYGDEKPAIGSAVIDGLVEPDKGEGLNVRVAGPDNYDAGEHTLVVTYDTENKNYNVTSKTDGTLNVEQRPITVKVKPAADVYVGDESPVNVVLDGKPENLVNGHTLSLTDATGTVVTTAAGSQAITNVTGAVKIMAGKQDVTKNYKVTYAGTAEVKAKYIITVTVTNGKADPSGEVPVKHGEDQTITFTAGEGMALDSVTVDGESDTLTEDGKYTFDSVTGNHTINVVYAADTDGDGTPDDKETNQITVNVTNGTAAPADNPITVPFGTEQKITFTAKEGYTLKSVTVDGDPAKLTDGAYTFNNVTAPHTINVEFAKRYTVTYQVMLGEDVLTEYTQEFQAWEDEATPPYTEDVAPYTKGEWDSAVAETVTGDATYTAILTPPDANTRNIDSSATFTIQCTEVEKHTMESKCLTGSSYMNVVYNSKTFDAATGKWTAEVSVQVTDYVNSTTTRNNYFGRHTHYNDAEMHEDDQIIDIFWNAETEKWQPVEGQVLDVWCAVKPEPPTVDALTRQIKQTGYKLDSNKPFLNVKDYNDPSIYTWYNSAELAQSLKDYITIGEVTGSEKTGFYATMTINNIQAVIDIFNKEHGGGYVLDTEHHPYNEYTYTLKFNDGIDGNKYNMGAVDYTDLSMWYLDTTKTTYVSGGGDKWNGKYLYVVKQFTVTYTDGVEDEELFQDKEYTVPEGSATPEFGGTPEWAGHVFTGWLPVVAETVTEDVTYVAQWKVYTSLTATIHNHFATKRTDAAKQHLWYTITNADGEVVVPETEVPRTTSYPQMVGATVVYGDNAVYESKGLIVTVPIQLEKALPAGDYTITYRLDGWQNLSVAVADTWVDEDTLIHTFTVAEDEGKDSIDAGTIETWTYEYKLIFDGNGGAPVPDPMYGVCASCDPGFDTNKTQNFVIPDEVPQKEGYVFIGWTDTKPADYGKNGENGLSLMAARATPKPTVKYYQPGDTYQIVRGTSTAGATVTLYANWEKACTVTYTDGVDDEVLFPDQVYEVKKGANAPAFEGTPTREHYDFIGWATTPDGNVEYAPGTAIKVTGDLTLYAVWQVKTYKQPFTAYVDGLYKSEVMSDAFQMSCTLKFGDGTEIKLDKAKDATFGWLGSPNVVGDTWTDVTISWTVELPETVKGETITVADLVEAYDGYQIRDNYNGKADRSTMYKGSESGVGVMSVDVMMMTYYHTANGGAVKRSGSAVTPPYAVETNMPHKNPTGATAEAAPGYVFKGWYTCDADGTVTSEEPVTTNEVLTAADMAHVNDTTVKSNQHFVPVFEKAEMKVEGVNKEYAYDTFYPEVTFTGDLKADALGLTVQYREKEGDWTDTPIGIMHVADSRTIYVRAVDAEGNEVFEEQPAALNVTPHKVTVKSSDVTAKYSGYATGIASGFTKEYGVEVFYEAKGSSGYGTFIGSTCDGEINVGTYEEHFTFTLNWGHPNLARQDPIYESDYDCTIIYGELVIEPLKIHIGKDTTKTVPYNGKEQVFELSAANITTPTESGDISTAKGYTSRIASTDTLTADFRGTEVGTYDELNWKIVNTATSEDMSKNYIVTYAGGLTIEQAKADDSGASVEIEGWIYGEEPNAPVVTSDNETVYPGDDAVITYVDADGNKTSDPPVYAGNYTVEVTWPRNDNRQEKTVTAAFTIEKRSIFLYADNADSHFVYNGEEQTLTATVENLKDYEADPRSGYGNGNYMLLAEGDHLASVDGTIVNMSGTDYTIGRNASWNNNIGKENSHVTIENAAGEDVTRNYKGMIGMRLWIDPLAITIKADDKNAVYGDEIPELTATVTGRPVNGDEVNVSLSREEGKDVGEYTITPSAVDLSINYTVTYESGTLTITKRPVTLTSAGDTKEYDGKPLTNETVTVSGDGFAEGEGAAYSVTGSQTLVGSSANEFTYTLNENTKADNYEITTKKGTLTVTDRTEKYVINMQPNGGTATYDGEGHSASGFAAQSFTVNGQSFTVEGLTASASGTNADTYPVQVTGTAMVRDADGNDVTKQFNVTYGSASLVINKASVTVKPVDASKVYDGEELTVNAYEVTAGRFYGSDAAKYTFTYGGSQTVAGSSASSVTVTLNAGEADNYTVTATNGTLTVTDRGDPEHPLYAIGMQPIGGTATYDGAPHSAGGFAAQSFTVEGKTYTVEGVNAGVTATNAGTYPVQITGEPIVRDADGNDVTKQFNVTYGSASLTIGRKAVTVTANNAGKVYGTNDPASFTAAVTGLVGSDRLNYSVTREAGENVGTYAIIPGGAAVQGNYDVTYVNGAFTITSQAITGLTVNGPANVVYDGAAHQWTPTVTGANGAVLQAGRDYNVAYNTGNFTDAGTVNVTITGTGNYSGSVTRTYQITPRAVTLTSATATKVYDGAALTAGNVTAEGFVPGEGAAFNVTGGRTIVGTSLNTFTYTLNANTNAANYVIGQTFGTLTVTPAALAVNVPANIVYDGAAHQWAPTVTGVNGAVLQAGRDYNVAYGTGNFTDAGTVNVTVTGAGNYTGTVTRAYTITPRDVTLTSASATRAYNGAALTAGNVTAEGFADGEGATYNVTGRRTIVGTSLNAFTYTLNANTDADNYNISRTFGTLTVTPAALTVNVPANTVYDGTAHQWVPTVTGANGAALQAGRDYNVAYSTGNFTDAGTVNVTITGAGNYTGTVTRTYTITPRDVTLTSASATKVYDGTALTAGNVTAQGFAPGEGATYNVTGRRTIVGTSLNAFTYTLNANTDAGNYNISRVFGRLVVTQAEGPAPDEGPNGPGNGPDNGPGNGPDNDVNPDNEANTADITEDEVPLGGEPEIEAASEDIPEDDVPMGALPDKEQEYSLSEEVVISEDETPLGAAPTEADCCILHFILMLCALGVAVYYTYDRKRHQKREFELRSELK